MTTIIKRYRRKVSESEVLRVCEKTLVKPSDVRKVLEAMAPVLDVFFFEEYTVYNVPMLHINHSAFDKRSFYLEWEEIHND
jgi:hypothetical protein